MVEWAALSIVLVVIILFLLLLIVTRLTKTGVSLVDAFIKGIKRIFCCELLGCKGLIGMLNPVCWLANCGGVC